MKSFIFGFAPYCIGRGNYIMAKKVGNKKGEVREVSNYCYASDLLRLFRVQETIGEYTRAKKDIPHQIIQEYLDLLMPFPPDPLSKKEQAALNKSLLTQKEWTIDFFKDKEKYHFSIPRDMGPMGPFGLQSEPFIYCLNDFFHLLFSTFREDYLTDTIKTKHSLTVYTFQTLQEYFEEAGTNPIPLTRYAQYVITGAVVASFDLVMTEKEFKNRHIKSRRQPYTEYLHDTVKYIIKSAK